LVRENTEGLYGSLGGRFKPGTADEMALQEHVSTYRGVRRILDYAFSVARSGVVMADKPNAMPHAGALWHRCWREVCEAHPDVPAQHLAIDACALHMITEPWQFDVIVTENCFGDILSDIAGGLVGGVGFAPSANLNGATGSAMFEPVHGSAPDIAGTGTANPGGGDPQLCPHAGPPRLRRRVRRPRGSHRGCCPGRGMHAGCGRQPVHRAGGGCDRQAARLDDSARRLG
jgi:3-isopropylmalate dehydrogenase